MGSNVKLPKITTAVFGSEAQGRDPLGVILVPTDLTAVPAATPASLFIHRGVRDCIIDFVRWMLVWKLNYARGYIIDKTPYRLPPGPSAL
jgi:hypothetical protein